MFGFLKAKCTQCGMKLEPDKQLYEWQDNNFCSGNCKQSFRHRKIKGGECCH